MDGLPCEAGKFEKWRDGNPLESGLRSTQVPTELTQARPHAHWARLGSCK